VREYFSVIVSGFAQIGGMIVFLVSLVVKRRSDAAVPGTGLFPSQPAGGRKIGHGAEFEPWLGRCFTRCGGGGGGGVKSFI
jgi:hypothetical protein